MTDSVLVAFDANFPFHDIQKIGEDLTSDGCFAAGFIPSDRGPLDIISVHLSQEIKNCKYTVILDRNITSRVAKIAREGFPKDAGPPNITAARIMAYCLSMDFHIEPGLAFHELASKNGNQTALEELAWFRVADQSDPKVWLEFIHHGKGNPLSKNPEPVEYLNLDRPLYRWQRNYISGLKVAELELMKIDGLKRIDMLFDWMINEFIVAGPAALIASFYLSPGAKRKGMFEKLRSPNRDVAILGIRKEAWDITYLSHYIDKVKISYDENNNNRYIFATADRNLALIAGELMPKQENETRASSFNRSLEKWWPSKHAKTITLKIEEMLEIAESRERSVLDDKIILDLTSAGEKRIREYKP